MLQIDIQGNQKLPENTRIVFETMFPKHRRIVVKKEFTGNLSGSRVFLVQPITDRGSELPLVVKLASVSLIQKESHAFQNVRNRLYGVVKVQDEALLPNCEWGALSYPLQGGGTFNVESFYEYCRSHDTKDILFTLNLLFRMLQSVHNQSMAAPGFFWRPSYDSILPLNLLIEPVSAPKDVPLYKVNTDTAHHQQLHPGDWVRLEGFAVTKVDLRKRTVTLKLSYPSDRDSYCVRLKLVKDVTAYGLNETTACIEGKVLETRESQLQTQIERLLGEGVDIDAATFVSPDGVFLPNPLLAIQDDLGQYRDVRVSLIHGDLNLQNILVDSETRAPSLIDVAEARENHIIHDFLRLETEVMTKLLADTLHRYKLSPSRTVSDLYQQLHCATFEGHQLSKPNLPHPELEKTFEVLKVIREAVRRYLYADDPVEYYQGLRLYLIGALKFANLDQLPCAPFPKQTALWGAATIQGLLQSAPDCQEMSPLNLRDQSPHALILDYDPEVRVLHAGESQLIDVSYGMPLRLGDTVSTFVNAKAVVHCNKGPIFVVPAERNQHIDCQDMHQRRLLDRLDIRHSEQLPRIVGILGSNMVLSETVPEPLLLSPRNTNILDIRPIFHWRPVKGARGYRLSLRMPNGETWCRETSSTTLSYPDDVSPLRSGSSNTVVLEVLGETRPSEKTSLQILDENSLAKIKRQEATVRALAMNAITESILLAQLYQEWRLWDAAIDQLEKITRVAQRVSPAMWLQLGTLYLQTGLYDYAEQRYRTAFSYARADGEARIQAIAQIGLACTYYIQNRIPQALTHLSAAASGEYGDIAQALLNWLEGTPQMLSAPQDPLTFIDYVRFISESLTPHLVDQMRKIPNLFLERLGAMKGLTLKPTTYWAPAQLGQSELEAMEILAVTYVTTHTLVDVLMHMGVECQPEELLAMLQEHARHSAQTVIGFSPEQAQDFAQRYATLVTNDPSLLQQLMIDRE